MFFILDGLLGILFYFLLLFGILIYSTGQGNDDKVIDPRPEYLF